MPISSPEDYADAQRWLDAGVDDEGEPVDAGRLQKAMQRYERFAMPEKATTELVAKEGIGAVPPPRGGSRGGSPDQWQEAGESAIGPSQEKNGYWAPPRPLTDADWITEDSFGKLKVWHDMPIEVYRTQVAAPARDKAIQDGIRAETELQRYGLAAFSPEDLQLRTQAIEAGRNAQKLDPNKLTEDDPAFKAFNDSLWAQEIQKRAADPEAGPLQRFTKMTGWRYAVERAKRSILAASRGAGDTMSLGAASGLEDVLAEHAPKWLGGGREAVDYQRGVEAAHPWSRTVGAVLGMMNPLMAGPALMRMTYQLAKPLGPLGAAALAGGTGAVTEGLGKNLSEMGADALSGAPSVTPERNLLEQANSDAAFGAAGGMIGEGVLRPLGKAIYNKAAQVAARRTGRPALEQLEEAGVKLSPARGLVPSEEMKDVWNTSRGRPGEYTAERVAGPINDAITDADALLTRQHGAETGQFFSESTATRPAKSTWGLLRQEMTKADAEQLPKVRSKLLEWSDLEPIAAPPEVWSGRGKNRVRVEGASKDPGVMYMRAGELRDVGGRELELSPDAQQMVGQLADLPAEAWVKVTPRVMYASEFYAKNQNLAQAAQQADQMRDKVLGRVWRSAAAAALEDRGRYPETKSVRGLTATVKRAGAEPLEVRGWSAQQARQSAERTAMDKEMQLTGARSGELETKSLPDQTAELNRKIASVGKTASSATEDALMRWAPNDAVRRELMVLRGIQIMDDARKQFDTGLTRPGMTRAVARALPGMDLLAGDIPARTAGVGQLLGGDVAVPGTAETLRPGTPLSDALYSWLNARMPRMSMFVPGMDIAKLIGEEDRIRNKPVKNVGDLTPQQREFLQEVLQ